MNFFIVTLIGFVHSCRTLLLNPWFVCYLVSVDVNNNHTTKVVNKYSSIE
ncbi:unnamed protein product [Schistosoma curassoni]|uniref:Uncharacterized protein n=1 Tax=Schistosoma curassoni TaxID=6186 RepID=A0A183JEY7_9TREM|nr:unnamed protein product [Schistosoma curassoni]